MAGLGAFSPALLSETIHGIYISRCGWVCHEFFWKNGKDNFIATEHTEFTENFGYKLFWTGLTRFLLIVFCPKDTDSSAFKIVSLCTTVGGCARFSVGSVMIFWQPCLLFENSPCNRNMLVFEHSLPHIPCISPFNCLCRTLGSFSRSHPMNG